jgi:hypothetical protein
MMERFRKEQIEVSYARLFIYRENIYDLFNRAIEAVRAVETTSFIVLQRNCQAAIMEPDAKEPYPAMLGLGCGRRRPREEVEAVKPEPPAARQPRSGITLI